MGRSGQKRSARAKRKAERNKPKVETPTAPQHPLMTIATRLPMVLLSVVIVLLIPAPFTSSSRWLNDVYENFLGPIIVVAAFSCILIASVMGAAVMMGWQAGIVGVVFTGSITAASVGVIVEDPMWTNIGVVGFALSCTGYYFIGELSGYLPVKTRAAYGSVAMIPGGIIMGVVGVLTASELLLLFGFGGAAAALGVVLAQWWRRRRVRAAAARTARTAAAAE